MLAGLPGTKTGKTGGNNQVDILDATAGNRTMWQTKNSENIIYIDIQKQLWVKPTIYASNEQTPFRDKQFHTIFYDPPHDYGDKPFDFNMGKVAVHKQWLRKKPFGHTYYGWDIYKTKRELIAHIWRAQKEFQRILRDDGLLWVKWCEIRLSLKRLLNIFADWRLLMKIHVKSPTQTWGNKQTYWLLFEKKLKGKQKQLFT